MFTAAVMLNFRSLIGFDINAVSNFVTADGKITNVTLVLQLNETSTNGTPNVLFKPHAFASVPAAWDGWKIGQYTEEKWFGNKDYRWHYIGLNGDIIRNPANKQFFNGIALMPKTVTEEDWCKFNGKSAMASFMEITVIK